MAGTSYEITAVIGRGGFGTVYRARMSGPHGFQRDIALKLLKEREPDADVLGRFRDEARLLGQIRHPSIPGVGAPVRLAGRWGVTMDLVEGRDCFHLLKEFRPFPVRAVLDLVAEISETLHYLYTFQSAPTDSPLALVHRDIKPSNILIGPSGTVHLLDFGIAKASFVNRETFTTDTVGGTLGYIPPERLNGVDGPEGDIYSLGVVMHLLLTGEKPQPFCEPEPVEPKLQPAVDIAWAMRALKSEERPDGTEVANRCRHLSSTLADELSLKEWARLNLVAPEPMEPDDRVGTILTEKVVPVPTSNAARMALLLLAIVAVGLVAYAGWSTLSMGARDSEIAAVPKQLEEDPAPQPTAAPDASVAEPAPLTPVAEATVEPPNAAEPETVRAPDPAPPEPKAPPVGTVSIDPPELEGWLIGPEGRSSLNGAPYGNYALWVVFEGSPVHAADVTVGPAKVHVRCNPRFKRCTP